MAEPISISIALCTCNGQRFLLEQLRSLANQSFLPTELVVCDDASDDLTFELVEHFSRSAPFLVRLYRNQKRLGIVANFEQAIDLCSGSIISLCDQDDVWFPEKLAHYAAAFSKRFDWVCCDARVTNWELSPLTYSLWDRLEFDVNQRELAKNGHFIEILLKHYVVAGATLAFRADRRSQLLPIPKPWLHDAWLASLLAAFSNPALIDEPLQFYRQHEGNAIGARRRNLFTEVRSALNLDRTAYLELEILRCQLLIERIGHLEAEPWVAACLEEKCNHLLRRAALPSSRLTRIPYVLSEIKRRDYFRFARNWGSVALDVFVK